MAGARKLQAEIDRTLKKIEEGLDIFDVGARKVETCDTPSLKIKMEEDLKRELKKLQKQRDAIKGWAASTEVKVKTPLLDARRNIELRMERFKVIERESKMKAYSKEGLLRDTPLTPEDKRRLKTREWVDKLGAWGGGRAARARARDRRPLTDPRARPTPSPLQSTS